MYYTDIRHYLRLKEQKHDITGLCIIFSGIVLAVVINLVLLFV